MTIVPIDTPLEVETMIANKDIGFVRVGQLAVIKVEAFPFTRYGTIGGTVTTISRDAVDNRDSTNLSDATAAVKTPGGAPNSSTSKPELVFPTTINLVQRSMEIDGHEVSLSAGMDVTVEIKTGRRRVINYILSPLWEVVSQTAHER
jgi:hemolysin D